MKLPKQKKCKQCLNLFTPYNYLTKVCSVQCALQYNIDHPKEVKTFIQLQEEKGIKAEIKKFKANLKNHAYWIKEYQKVFNGFIRERDKNQLDICCDKPLGKVYHAGHFFSTGAYPGLRFDEDNCHAQNERCNLHLHGNSANYAIKLPKRIGQERFEALYNRRKQVLKLSIPEIQELIKHYKNKTKELKLNP